MTGRPTLYTADNAQRILDELTHGRALRAVCRDQGMPPYSAVRQWIADDRQKFGTRYRQVRTNDKAGCPSLYTTEVADRILRELANDRALDVICRDPGMPSASAVREWVRMDRDGFAARYRRARDVGHARPGPPTTYDEVIADYILQEMCGGRTLTQVCRDPDMPLHTTVRHWARENHGGFAAPYNQARRICIEMLADEMIDIADNCHNDWITLRKPDGTTETILDPQRIARARLRCKARRWLITKALGRNPEQWMEWEM